MVDEHQDVTAAVRERLLGLRVSDEEGYRSDTVEISLDDRGGMVELPRRGAELKVELGYEESGRVSMGRYTVDEVELSGPPATISIRAKAADMRATLKQRKTRSWHQISIGDLVATVAAEHGLESRTAEDLRGIVLPHVDQTDESDLHLLTRLGEQYDAEGRPWQWQTGIRPARDGEQRHIRSGNPGEDRPRADHRLPRHPRRPQPLPLGKGLLV